MDKQFIEGLLGEFAPEFYKPVVNHFRHIVGNTLALAQTELDLRRPERAEADYAHIRIYLVALREMPRFREREFATPVPKECDPFDTDCNHSIEKYVELARRT